MARKPRLPQLLHNKSQRFVIVATSSRFLAASATAAGYNVVAIDAFADADTRALADECVTVPLGAEGLDATAVANALSSYPRTGLVLGPGLDGAIDFIEEASKTYDFYGNAPDVFRACACADTFMQHLDKLGIAHPGTHHGLGHMSPIVTKMPGASGGAHVRFARTTDTKNLQRYVAGTTVSHLFVAAGGRIATIGMNTLWPSTHTQGHTEGHNKNFCYGGGINRAPLNDEQQRELITMSTKLAKHFDLCGINSLDCVLSAGRLYCLELNPRPSATMQLYEPNNTCGSLFQAHVQACRGELSPPAHAAERVRAHATVYALEPTALSVAECERPEVSDATPEQAVAAGAPLCSLIVAGDTVADTLSRLQFILRQVQAERH